EAIGEPAIGILKKAAQSAEDAEVRAAARAIVEAFEAKNSGIIRTFKEHGERVNGVAISADGKRAVSACWDGLVRYWNLEKGELIREMGKRMALLNSVAMSADSKRALTGSADRTMYLWDLETGQQIRAFQGHSNTLWDVAFSPDGKKALSASSDGSARLWDLDTGKELLVLDVQKGGRCWTVAFVAGGKQAITGSGDALDEGNGTQALLRLWDLSNGKEVRQFKGHTKDIRRVAISPDGKRLLSGSFDGSMRLWD